MEEVDFCDFDNSSWARFPRSDALLGGQSVHDEGLWRSGSTVGSTAPVSAARTQFPCLSAPWHVLPTSVFYRRQHLSLPDVYRRNRLGSENILRLVLELSEFDLSFRNHPCQFRLSTPESSAIFACLLLKAVQPASRN